MEAKHLKDLIQLQVKGNVQHKSCSWFSCKMTDTHKSLETCRDASGGEKLRPLHLWGPFFFSSRKAIKQMSSFYFALFVLFDRNNP